MTVNDTRIDFAEQSMSACNRATIHSRNRNFCTFPDAVTKKRVHDLDPFRPLGFREAGFLENTKNGTGYRRCD